MDQQTINYYTRNAAEVASRYEAVTNSLVARFAESFPKGGKVLDVGCGSGRDLAILADMGYQAYGVDAVGEFVALAQSLHPELEGKITSKI